MTTYRFFFIIYCSSIPLSGNCSEISPQELLLVSLHTAVTNKDKPKVKNILQECPELLNTSPYGPYHHTVLHIAASTQDHLMLEILLKYSHYIDPLDSTESTPLHLIFDPTRIENLQTENNSSFKELQEMSIQDCALALVRRGAQIYLANNQDETPHSLAKRYPLIQNQMESEYEGYYCEKRSNLATLLTSNITYFPIELSSLIASLTM